MIQQLIIVSAEGLKVKCNGKHCELVLGDGLNEKEEGCLVVYSYVIPI